MDQETAQALFNKSAFLLFLNAPKGLEFGIDYNSWEIGPKFKGVKLIPPGLHFVYYSTSDKSQVSGLRNGFFKFYESQEIVIKEWDSSIEDLKRDEDMDPEQNERLNSDMRQFDQFLGAYPLSPSTNWEKWVHLTNFITPLLIERVLPHNGKLSNASSSTVDEEELQNIGGSNFKEDTVMFTKFDLKKSWRSGAVGQEITKYSQDKSWLLEDLLKNVYNNDYKELLGELQLSFVCLLVAQNFSGFTQWKNLVQLICTCEEAINTYADTFFTDLIDVIKFQLDECPQDFFYDVISENNFLSSVLKTLYKNILELALTTEPSSSLPVDTQRSKRLHNLRRKFEKFRGFLNRKFHWEIAGDSNNDEEEEGEYAPVVVELPEESSDIVYITEFSVQD
ncbi:17104_t:CDS:2 [Acaulospora morrowiae]|uniref:17104_t:CDS:1 n=1 Tax=Acaulospora morrowiae TaxID=94023 RepID=A0A9N9C9V3_9GLOM|nr:17104_t:CDS:2 [Acaulospora morrowiae]